MAIIREAGFHPDAVLDDIKLFAVGGDPKTGPSFEGLVLACQ
jgi:hypothetical protein